MIIINLLIILFGVALVSIGMIAIALMFPFFWAIYALLFGLLILIKMGVISVD